MARKKKHFRKSFTLPLAVVAGMAPVVVGTFQHGMWNGWAGPGDTAVDYLTRSLTGYSPNSQGFGGKFNFRNMQEGLLPIIIGIGAHKIAGRLGINRALGRMGIPLIRI